MWPPDEAISKSLILVSLSGAPSRKRPHRAGEDLPLCQATGQTSAARPEPGLTTAFGEQRVESALAHEVSYSDSAGLQTTTTTAIAWQSACESDKDELSQP